MLLPAGTDPKKHHVAMAKGDVYTPRISATSAEIGDRVVLWDWDIGRDDLLAVLPVRREDVGNGCAR